MEWLARVMGELAPEPDGVAADGLVADGLVADGLVADGRAGTLERGVTGAVAVGRVVWSAGAVAGLNVATDSIAPATRHTARMLASSGMTVPCPANGLVSRRSRFLRRCARSSRW